MNKWRECSHVIREAAFWFHHIVNWLGPEQTVWYEKEPKWLKTATMHNFLPLVRTRWSKAQMWNLLETEGLIFCQKEEWCWRPAPAVLQFSFQSVKKERIRFLLSPICLFQFYVPVISATWAKCLWGDWCVSWKWCRAADRWATLIRLCVFKWKGIYLREWPKAGVKHRNGEDFLFSKSQGRATSSRAHSDPVATQSAFREF